MRARKAAMWPPVMWPDFVRDHADHLVGRLRLHQRAGVDEDVAPVEHEGVEGIVLHDADLDAPGAEPGRAEDRLRVVGEQVLDLGVADERQVLRGARASAAPSAASDAEAAECGAREWCLAVRWSWA